jgi:branched-chain amino acid transport system substrate-binding protein
MAFRTTRRRGLLAAAASVAVLATACSSSDGPSTGASGSAPVVADLTQAQIDWAVKFTGGKLGRADSSLAPVTIGYVDQEGGTLSFPEATTAFDATLTFVNEQLGGIAGHPVQGRKCLAAGPEDVLKCGTQMANDADVKALVIPLLLLNNEAFYNALGGKKPILDGTLIFPIDFTTPNVYTYNSGGPVGSQALAVMATQKLNAKRVVFVRTDNPAGLAAVKSQIAAVQAAGAQTADIPVPEPGTAPQYASAIRAANLKDDDVVNLSLTSIGCATSFDALRNLRAKVRVLASEGCLLEPVPGHLKNAGEKDTLFPDGWYMSNQGYSAAAPGPDTNGADVYASMMKKYAPGASSTYGYAPSAFANTMALVKHIAAAGGTDATSEQIAAQIRAYKGPAIMSAGALQCGALPAAPNLCNFTIGYLQRKDGAWLQTAAGAQSFNTLSTLQGK